MFLYFLGARNTVLSKKPQTLLSYFYILVRDNEEIDV